MEVKFCGAAQYVTGSAHLITLDNGYKILLDCGLFQGRGKKLWEWNNTWHFEPSEIDCVILSHGHIDHTGRIPQLVKDGFKGKIYATHATRSLCSLMLLDSAMIQERDINWHNRKMAKKGRTNSQRVPLYTSDDIPVTMEKYVGCPYGKWMRPCDNVQFKYSDAGHILGSASINIEITENGKTTRIGFTGDVGRPNRPILRDPQPMDPVDYLICESTYGAKDHEGAPNEFNRLLKVIKETCVEKKGKLIIPAFSVGRTQEIVYMLDQMANSGVLPRIPVYVDSPLAINATTIYGTHAECYDNELNKYLLEDDNPFGFNTLKYIRKVDDSKALNDKKDACIIISSSGMMNAGRVKHHLYNNVQNPKNTFLIVGYCTPETPGGQLRSGNKTIRLFGDELIVKADVVVMDSFSAHADRTELYEFVKNQKKSLKKLFLVHGEIEGQTAFKSFLEERGFDKIDIEIPAVTEKFKLK